MRPHAKLSFLILLLLLVTACSDGESTPPETTTTAAGETPTTEATTTSAAAANESEPTLSIRMAAFAFSGDDSGSVGDTVRVVNNDDFSHTWTSTDQAFHSGTLGPGEEFLHTFSQAGTFTYFCQIHPEMSGTITIKG